MSRCGPDFRRGGDRGRGLDVWRVAVWILVLLAVPAREGTPAQEPDESGPGAQEPTGVGLEERAVSRLVQLDVTVTGPPEVIRRLTAEDFKLKVHLRKITDFRVDRLCEPPAGADSAGSESSDAFPSPERTTTSIARARSSYLIYFDQPFLTMSGRMRGIEIAHDLIRDLLADGGQAMIVSNAGRLAVLEPLTDDVQRLIDALDRLEGDRKQWDFYASQERDRTANVIKMLNEADRVERSIALARRYQREERIMADKSLRRLANTLTRMYDLGAPKGVFYFADTMRSNAGAHYTRFFGSSLKASQNILFSMESDPAMVAMPFDKVINDAAAQGIRFYTIRPQGLPTLVQDDIVTSRALSRTQGSSGTSNVRHQHAADTLANLASETGGLAFLAGEKPSRIAARVREEFSCVYLLSFDAEGFTEDRPLRVIAELRDKPGVRLHARGRVVVQSESAKTTARLLSAFTVPGRGEGGFSLNAGLIPTAFHDGKYSALLQVSVPGSPIPGASWEMGASVIFRDRVSYETSGSLKVSAQDAPVVYEKELELKPGSHEIVVVAHETATGLLSSQTLDVEWPKPGLEPLIVGPVALVQPALGAFLRDGESRTSGSLARAPGERVIASQPLAMIALVCRSGRRDEVRVERRLVGESPVEFDPLVLDPSQERCVQIRDVVRADTLSGGVYRYEIDLTVDDARLNEAHVEFEAYRP